MTASKAFVYTAISVLLLSTLAGISMGNKAGTNARLFAMAFQELSPTDTVPSDSSALPFPIPRQSSLLFPQRSFTSPLYLKNPSNYSTYVEYNPVLDSYEIKRRIGNMDFGTPTYMNLEEYSAYNYRQSTQNYWTERARTERMGRSADPFDRFLNPQLNVGVEGFDKVFGSNTIDIKPNGAAELIFGINYTNSGDPSLPEHIQKNTTFEFDEKIQMGVTGQIGDKLRVGINYNTEAMFQFENKTKLAYTGKEDEIIQNIEAGNVSFPLNGSLISGSHSLFGLKTELKFGNLRVTTVISRQEGKSQVIEIEGGAQKNYYEISAGDYEANKHFFLAHYFKENYDKALQNLPIINSGVTITRIEVWVTNKTGNFENSRNIAGFMDLAEGNGNIYSPIINQVMANNYPQDSINNLYTLLTKSYAGFRDISQITNVLKPLVPDIEAGRDYEKIENARKLEPNEFNLNTKLGYISLNFALNADEVLAVAYEYTVGGKVYRVGEFSNGGISAPQTLLVKLLKGTSLTPKFPTWDLMMKNVYAIGAYQVNPEDFILDILYQNDNTGTAINYLPEGKPSGKVLLQLLNLDQLNSQLDPSPDGYFDFINQITINASNGRLIFPKREPFGSYLRTKFEDQDIADKYVFEELYDSTQNKAQQVAEKNKFFLSGSYQSASGSEIFLNAMNIPQGSVKVTAGGRQLNEGDDYLVDYTLGRVTILNHGLLESGTPISISLESNELFNFETKTLFGTHLDYRINDNFNLGATLMNLTEKPFTNKVNIGDEPISNTIWGLDGTYSSEIPFLTKLVDKIPFIDTKAPSSISITGEFAHLIPGHSRAIEKEGISYIDDFEGSKTSLDLKTPNAWVISSAPQGQDNMFPEANLTNMLPYGYNRARLAWYTVNSDLVNNRTGATPPHLAADPDQQSNHFVREVIEKEIFPFKESPQGIPTPLSVLNLAYYPTEKGPYNYDIMGEPGISAGVDENGELLNPASRWGGIMRKIQTNDFEASNIEYIEFWLMDPFVYDSIHEGGDLYFNLGNISEDILKDSRKSFENGLPPSANIEKVDTTVWGRVPMGQSLVNAFDNNPASRAFQDVGLDGLSDQDEQSFFQNYLDSLATLFGENSLAYRMALEDVSNDNYHYFKGSDYDTQERSILERYKHYNGLEGNSPTAEQSDEDYGTSATLVPDVEDINQDNTLSENESYFQYKVSLRPEDMVVGRNYITDMVVDTRERKNKQVSTVKWYQFKIPIFEPERSIGAIQDFKSIRFMRLFLRGFDQEIVLRFARLDLVRGEWRKYNFDLSDGGEVLSGDQPEDASFEISAINIEENGKRTPINYVLPPGIRREQDPTNPLQPLVDEQSLVLKVQDLPDGSAQAAYRNVDLDVRQYRKLKMDVHAEALKDKNLLNDELSVFIRLGSDYQQNYYEYEVPLKVTPEGFYTDTDEDRLTVWPAENQIEIIFEILQQAKQARNDAMRARGSTVRITAPYLFRSGNNRVRIMGNPNLSNIRTIMLGVRNPSQDMNTAADDGFPKSAEIWLNELRLTDFIEEGGWAANGRVTTRFADFASVTVAGSTSKHGFGSIEKKVNERSKEDVFQYDLSSNVELGKFFPQEAEVRIPMYVGYSENISNPQYNPLDPDIELKAALENAETKEERDSIKYVAQDYTRRRSINFTNVKIAKTTGTPHIYDISNWSVSYGYKEIYHRNINTEFNVQKEYMGAINFNFNNRPKNWAPFSRSKLFRKPAWRIIRDINLYYSPSLISFRTNMNRQYNEMQNRNIDNPDVLIFPSFKKDFIWDRQYDVKYNLTKNLKLDFAANNAARVDEPDGRINKDDDDFEAKRDTILQNIKDWGRTTQYNHRFNANYILPINKIPLLNWINVTAKYAATYDWNASPITADTIQLGNTIKNTSNKQISSQFNLMNLYNKVGYLKTVNQRMQQKKGGKSNQKPKMETVTFEQKNLNIPEGYVRTINHKLRTEQDIVVKITDENGQEIPAEVEIIGENKVQIKPEADLQNATIIVTGQVEQRPGILQIITDNALYTLMGVRNISVNYTQNDGTILPGYLPDARWAGMQSQGDVYAPGIPFILGWQDRDMAFMAAQNDWLTRDSLLNAAFQLTDNQTLSLRASLEPILGMRIDLSAERSITTNTSEYWIADENGKFTGENLQIGGNFKMSYNMLATAFWEVNTKTFESEAYTNFRESRVDFAWQLANDRYISQNIGSSIYNPNQPNIHPETGEPLDNGYPNGYGPLSQEVVLPAFLAAYSNKSADRISTEIFQKIPGLNWNITYDGLSHNQFVKKIAKNVNIRHSYKSSYNVNSYNSNPYYDFQSQDIDGFSYVRDNINGYFIPEQEVAAISLEENFNPLISVDMNLHNSLSTKVEFRKSRILSLSFANNQIEESYRKEYIFGVGYRFDKFPIIMKIGGSQKKFESDLNLRADVSIRDDVTVYRKIEENLDELYAGMTNVSIKASADYMLSNRFQLRLFYDQTITDPKKALAYRTVNAKFGISIRFSLIP